MTINLADNTPRVSYAVAAGVTQTSFTVSFEFFDDADLNVYVDGTLKTLTTDYTVTGGDGSTGSVSISVTGASGGSTVVITRDIDLKRTTDFPASGAFQVGSLNTELDKLVAIAADLDDKASRSLQLTDFDTAVSLVLPEVDTRKGKTLAFNATTGAVESGPSISDVQTVSAAAADIATLADIEDGTDATDAIQTVAGISANVTTVAGISSNVSTVAGISSDVTAVVGDEADIGTVATNIANVNTVAGIDSDVTTVAGINTQITSVAADAADIGAVAGKATEIGRLGTADAVADLAILGTADAVSDMNTLAPISSDITTVAGKASFITADFVSDLNTLAVTDVVNDINTLATSDIVADLNTLATSDIVSDLNTLATTDIVNDINLLATSDVVSDLNQLATSDFVSDLNLMATSQNISDLNDVAGSIANVNSVATNLSSVNSFADTYFVSATAPSSPTEGDLWFDTTNDIMKVYDGSGFVNAGSSVNGTSQRQTYTATSGQTSFAATYDTGYVDVYLNGVKLINGTDFTATDGSNVVLTSGAAAGDSVDIVAYGTFNLLNLDISNDTTPQLGGVLDTNGNNIEFGDSTGAEVERLKFGAGDDLQIYHDGSNSYISEMGSGLLYINSTSGGWVRIGSGNETSAYFKGNLAVELFYDNVKKFETTSTGVDVAGNVTMTSDDPTITMTDSSGTNDIATIQATSGALIVTARDGSADGEIVFKKTDGSATDETLRITNTGNVGINTSSPETILHATASSAIIRLTSDSNGTSGVDFGDSADTNIGRLLYDNSDNSMRFTTNAGERMRILSSGGITFNGDTAAANALDDYEFGDYDITLTPSTSGSITANTGENKGTYVKIGNFVQAQGRVLVSSVSSPSGDLAINLPFQTTSSQGEQSGSGAPALFVWNSTQTNNGLWCGFFDKGVSAFYIRWGNAATPGASASYIQGGTEIRFSVSYITDA